MSHSDSLLPLLVAQFELKGHPRRTEHWRLVALASPSTIHIFEVRGNTDSYTYVPEFNFQTPLYKISSYRGGCHIGNLPEGSLEAVKEKLTEVPIVKYDSSWDCQVWVMEAIKLLKEDGYIFPHVTEGNVRLELAEDMNLWQEAEDTVDERLLADARVQ